MAITEEPQKEDSQHVVNSKPLSGSAPRAMPQLARWWAEQRWQLERYPGVAVRQSIRI